MLAISKRNNQSKYDTNYILYVLIGFLVLSSLQYILPAQAELHVAKLKWFNERCTGLGQGVSLIEPDMNKNSKSIDTAEISVISDSDPIGITAKLKETGIDTGIFEGTVVFSFTEYSKDPLAVYNGDRITAKYQDETLPLPVFSGKLGISDTCIYTIGGPPLERVPASSIGVFGKDGNQIDKIKVDQQIQIRSDLANPTTLNQTFAYIVQIQNKEGIMVSLSWLSGVLAPSQAFSPSVSWIPSEAGNYTVNVFVWASISNPDALSVPLSADLQVISNSTHKESKMITENFQCKLGYELVIKSRDNSPACVKPKSMLRLVGAGWGYIQNSFETKTDLLNTTMTGGKIIGFKFDVDAPSIVINLETTSDGSLALTIPKALTDSMSWYKNNPSHGVLIDGQFLELDETITAGGTAVTIPFKQGAKIIEIFGSHEHNVINCPVDESLDLTPVKTDQFGNALRLVFFVQSNSTAQICIKYTSGFDNHGSIPVADQLIVDYYSKTSYPSTIVTVSAKPSSVPLEMDPLETFVVFTIAAPINSDGVYWLPQSQMCDAIPIVVWSDLPQVDSSKLPVLMGVVHGCPMKMLDAKIVGFSGAIMDYKPANPIGNQD